MGVIIRTRKVKDGMLSIYLDIHNKGRRPPETLDLYLYAKPKTTEQREYNREQMLLAEEVRVRREKEIRDKKLGIETPIDATQRLEPFLQDFLKNYKKKDINKVKAMIPMALEVRGTNVLFEDIDLEFCKDFVDALTSALSGESARAYFNKFRQAMEKAHTRKLTHFNIATFKAKIKGANKRRLKKDWLEASELEILWNTPCGNEEVGDSFIYSCFTGLRPGDVRTERGDSVVDGRFKKMQSKTGEWIQVPLSETAKAIYKKYNTGPNELLFKNLPQIDGYRETVKSWVKKAGIKKHITSYCGRHTFAMLLLESKSEWRSIIDLMGWSEENGMKMLMIYTRAHEKHNVEAVNKLPVLKKKKARKA